MNAISDFQNLWSQLGTSSRTTASPWLSPKSLKITLWTICNSAEQENSCVFPSLEKKVANARVFVLEVWSFHLYVGRERWEQPCAKSNSADTDQQRRWRLFFHIEEIKKKEVSETERKRERSQTASSAWGAAILEKCREQRWDCNAVKSSYIQHTQPGECFFFPPNDENKETTKKQELTKNRWTKS